MSDVFPADKNRINNIGIHCLVTEALKHRLTNSWIDEVAAGSDHQPLWAEFETD